MDTYTLHIPPYTQQHNVIIVPIQATSIDIIVGAHASIILEHRQKLSTNITITLQPYAQVHFVHSLTQAYEHQTIINCYQDQNSTLIFNGRYAYNIHATLHFYLQGQHANTTATCLIDANHTTQNTINSLQMHQAPYTTSNFLLKGLLQDHARCTHTGMIHIDTTAHNTHATLQSRYMLIGNHAQAYAQPQLEVLNKEVSCFHGSAIASCNDDDLFYLAARGLDKACAQQLICDAFLK